MAAFRAAECMAIARGSGRGSLRWSGSGGQPAWHLADGPHRARESQAMSFADGEKWEAVV